MKPPLFSPIRPALWALLGAVLVGCGDDPPQPPAPRPVAVRVVWPARRDLENRLSYLGTIRARQEIRVIAQVQGTIARLPVPEGNRVEAGALLAQLDAPELQASVERLQADRDYWQRRYEADQRLVAAAALPQEQVESSRRAYRSAEAALDEARARFARAREVSPLSGTVLSWLVEPGQHMMPGQPLLLLGGDASEIHVEVVEEDLQRGLQVGTPAAVYSQGKEIFRASVAQIAPLSTGPGRTFTARVPLPQAAAGLWRWGASARVDFVLASRPGCLSVPVEALARRGKNPRLFLVRQNLAVEQEVATGIAQDGQIEVLFPWNGTDRVAVSNLESLKDGDPVFAVEEEEVAR